MSKILSFIGILFFTAHSSGQVCQYQDYYALTDIAKAQTSKSNFKEAKRNFREAFSKIEFPLGHDLSVALYVADQTRDDSWAILLAEKLAKGGAPLRYFTKFKSRKWYGEFESKFEEYANFYEDHFNQDLRNQFIALLERDTEFTEKYHLWREGSIELTLEELIADEQEIEYLYNWLKAGLSEERKEWLDVGNDRIMTAPYMGALAIYIFYENGSEAWFDITKKRLDRLFGKR